MKKGKGPARTSAQWRKEVAIARDRLRKGWLAALAHGGMYVLAVVLVSVRQPMGGEAWGVSVGVAAVLAGLGWLVKRGVAVAALILLAGSLVVFLVTLVRSDGLHLNLTGIVFAWFYLEALRGALALSRRLHAPASEPPASRED